MNSIEFNRRIIFSERQHVQLGVTEILNEKKRVQFIYHCPLRSVLMNDASLLLKTHTELAKDLQITMDTIVTVIWVGRKIKN